MVLATLPASEDLVLAWFNNAENMLRSCEVPSDLCGSLIMPFLKQRSSALIAHKAYKLPSYEKTEEFILAELKRQRSISVGFSKAETVAKPGVDSRPGYNS